MIKPAYIYIFQLSKSQSVSKEDFCIAFADIPIWGNDNPDEATVAKRHLAVNQIYELSHMNMNDIIHKSRLSTKEFSAAFGIPVRTVQSWQAKNGKQPPSYLKMLLAESLGMFPDPNLVSDTMPENVFENIDNIEVAKIIKELETVDKSFITLINSNSEEIEK